MLLWAGSGDPKTVLGMDFTNRKKLIFLYAFFLNFFFWGGCPSSQGARIYKFGHDIPTLTHFWARVRHFSRLPRLDRRDA